MMTLLKRSACTPHVHKHERIATPNYIVKGIEVWHLLADVFAYAYQGASNPPIHRLPTPLAKHTHRIHPYQRFHPENQPNARAVVIG